MLSAVFCVLNPSGRVRLGIGKQPVSADFFSSDMRLLNGPRRLGGASCSAFPAAHRAASSSSGSSSRMLHSGKAVGSRHLFEIVQGSPAVIAYALALGSLRFPGQPCAETVLFRGDFGGFSPLQMPRM